MSGFELNANLARKIDIEVIPSIVFKPVTKRNYFALVNVLKRHQPLTRQLISFYYQTLKVNANLLNNNKSSCSFTIPWMTKTQELSGKPVILTPDEQYQLYMWITVNNNSNSQSFSNMQFLIFSLGNYLTQLRTAQRTLNQKQDACCYYNLGINVKNNQQLQNFLRQWIY